VLRFLSDMARRISNWLNTPAPVRASAEDRRWPLTCSACGWLPFYPPADGALWCRTCGYVMEWPPPSPRELARRRAERDRARAERRRRKTT
jgi:hypothetical protein